MTLCMIFRYLLDMVFVFKLWIELHLVPRLTILREVVGFCETRQFSRNKATQGQATTSGRQLAGGSSLSSTFYASIFDAVLDYFDLNYHCNYGEELWKLLCCTLFQIACFDLIRCCTNSPPIR